MLGASAVVMAAVSTWTLKPWPIQVDSLPFTYGDFPWLYMLVCQRVFGVWRWDLKSLKFDIEKPVTSVVSMLTNHSLVEGFKGSREYLRGGTRKVGDQEGEAKPLLVKVGCVEKRAVCTSFCV